MQGGNAQSGHDSDFDTQIINNGINNNLGAEPSSVPLKEGYVFNGWYTDDNTAGVLWDFSTNQVLADTTLYAKWQEVPVDPIKKYKVTFNMNGHGEQIAPQNIVAGNKAAKPKNPTEKGYVFKGWYIEKAFINAYDFNSKVNEDIMLYAKWEKAFDSKDDGADKNNESDKRDKEDKEDKEDKDLPITGNDITSILLLITLAMIGSTVLITRRESDIINK